MNSLPIRTSKKASSKIKMKNKENNFPSNQLRNKSLPIVYLEERTCKSTVYYLQGNQKSEKETSRIFLTITRNVYYKINGVTGKLADGKKCCVYKIRTVTICC